MERETMGVLKGICVSKKRGTKKVEVAEAMLVENYGIAPITTPEEDIKALMNQ